MTSVVKAPGTLADAASGGTISWINPTNAGASDDTYATATFAAAATSHFLDASNFGFTIPKDARIDGIEVRVEGNETAGTILDNVAQMILAGKSPVNLSTGRELAATDGVVIYGGPTNLHGETWVPADINSSSFKFRLKVVKTNAGAGVAQIDYISVTIYYTRPGDTNVTVVRFRRSEPPHEVLLESFVSGLRYGFKVRKMQQASFMIARSDPNVLSFQHLMLQDRPAMVTIERPDGYLPWVGFVDEYHAPFGDPFVTFTCNDHAMRLQNAAIRKKGGITTSQASGTLIADMLRECDARGAPPLYLKLDNMPPGPGFQYTPRSNMAFDFLEDVAKGTDWEWGFAYELDEKHCEAFLTWQDRNGDDHSQEEVWEEAKHFTKVSYGLKYSYGIDAALAVGGSGTYADRAAVEVSRGGQTRLGYTTAYKRTQPRGYGLGGTRVVHNQQTTDTTVLRQNATALHTDPSRFPEQISFTLAENQIDMSRLAIGDYRTIRLQTTNLGIALQRTVRLIGIELNPDTKEIQCETQVIPSA